jgi:predicted amino acid racemase
VCNFPRIEFDLNKVIQNTKNIVSLAKKYNISINGITKAVCANIDIAKAMIEGGVTFLGDSRIENIKKLKEKLNIQTILIRTPMISEVNEVIKYADISLNTEIDVIEKLDICARKNKIVHKIVLMVEMGDLREGILKEELSSFIDKILKYENIELFGIGMNLACYGGVIPTQEKIDEFEDIVLKIEKDKNISFKMVSGGNSAVIPLLIEGFKTSRITDLRIGEGILLGRETVKRKVIKNSCQDAFLLKAEIIELKKKPSIPDGEIGQDAFGSKPSFKDYGIIRRAILALGRQDINVKDLILKDPKMKILGSSSDHLILRLDSDKYKVGDHIEFSVKYGASLKAFTSKYVKKIVVRL